MVEVKVDIERVMVDDSTVKAFEVASERVGCEPVWFKPVLVSDGVDAVGSELVICDAVELVAESVDHNARLA